jgi:L-lysine 2,3-aminomutase
MTRQHATYTSCINSLPLDAQEARALRPVMEYYAFRANDYYLSLINWDDPADPIRRIIVPHPDETKDWGELDPSDEARYTAVPGMQHKYRDTAILLAGKACGGLCRFCFRKRIFMEGGTPPVPDTGKALAYIRAHKEITNVLISGGDPLLLPLAELEHRVAHARLRPRSHRRQYPPARAAFAVFQTRTQAVHADTLQSPARTFAAGAGSR